MLRALLYWQIGPEADWTPKLDLCFVVLAFRSTRFLPTLLFSVLSFGRILIICYFWLLALVVINRRNAEPDPMHEDASPAPWAGGALALAAAGASAAAGCGAGLWVALHPLLVQLGITDRARVNAHLIEQGLLVGTALYLSLQYVLPVFLFPAPGRQLRVLGS